MKRDINPLAIDRFLTYHYLPGQETLIKDILKLDPGHYLTVADGKITKKKYWDLDFNGQQSTSTFTEAVIQLQGLLRRTVKDHMISDVPVGVLLSGGVDSTGILRYAVEETDRPIHTFTIGFAGEGFADERPYARTASQRYGTIHQEISMSAADFRDFLPRYIWHMEEPVFEPPAVALYFVAKLARDSGVKVLLSGEGGDEAFGGYQNYRNLLILEKLKSALGPAKGLMRLGFKSLGSAGLKRFEYYAALVEPALAQYYLSRTSTPNTGFDPLKDTLYTGDFKASLHPRKSEDPITQLTNHPVSQSLLNYMLYVDTKTWLPDDLLVKADKMTMATSVELRVPLLDFQVLEFAAMLPSRYKVCGWTTKRILKKALEESVPRTILDRKKTGFPVPYVRWLREEMDDFIRENVLEQNPYSGLYFSSKEIRRIYDQHKKNQGFSREVFCLMVLSIWNRIFLKGLESSGGSGSLKED